MCSRGTACPISAFSPPSRPLESSPAPASNNPPGDLPFHLTPAAAADLLAARCRTASLRSLRRIAVSDFSTQGVLEFAAAVAPSSHLVVVLDRAADLAAAAPRKPRDEGKESRGFALLCFADAEAADRAAASGAFAGLKVERACTFARPYYLGAVKSDDYLLALGFSHSEHRRQS